MKKNIIFDASVLVTSYLSDSTFKTGIYRVTYEVLLGLSRNDSYTIYLYDIYGRERELREHITQEFKDLIILSVDSDFYRFFAYPLFNRADYFRRIEINTKNDFIKQICHLSKNGFQFLGRILKKIERRKNAPVFPQFTKSDVYFSTYQLIPNHISFISGLQKIIIVHDLIPILHPEYFYKIDNKDLLEGIIQSISYTDKVICVSESTRHDFLKLRPIFNSSQVYVSLLAGSSCFRPIKSNDMEIKLRNKYKLALNRDFFLSVCTIEPRKNIQLLISAYEKLLLNNTVDVPLLILTGAYGWKSQTLLENINRINKQYPLSIILSGFVSDEELAVLYSNTIGFIYPSLYEGFGLPPLEAMQCGAPVITSDNSSLPEVVGEAGILINAKDEEGLYNAMIECMNPNNKKKYHEKSIQRAKEFSWKRTVNRIIEVIEDEVKIL